MRLALIISALLLGAYALLMAYAYYFSDEKLFFPSYGSHRIPDGLVVIPTESQEPLMAVYLPNEKATHTLWYFHGNAEDLGDIEPRLNEFRERGYAVFAVEYPGYGLNPGLPTEESIYAGSQVGLRYLTETLKVPLSKVIAYGRSIGGGPAVELASKEPIAGLILESAFTSAFRVVTGVKLLPFDKFDNLQKIPEVNCPILFLHGGDDRIVPFSHAETLFEATRAPKMNLWVEVAGHNDFMHWAGPSYWQSLSEFTESLR